MFVTPISPAAQEVFESVSLQAEQKNHPKYIAEQLSYYVTEMPIASDISKTYSFVYALFETGGGVSFSSHQSIILNLASKIFQGASSLGQEEQIILNEVFYNSLKTTPTRPNRN